MVHRNKSLCFWDVFNLLTSRVQFYIFTFRIWIWKALFIIFSGCDLSIKYVVCLCKDGTLICTVSWSNQKKIISCSTHLMIYFLGDILTNSVHNDYLKLFRQTSFMAYHVQISYDSWSACDKCLTNKTMCGPDLVKRLSID